MYAKILSNKHDYTPFNRRIFDEAAIVATTIEQFKNSTFENFYMNKSE